MRPLLVALFAVLLVTRPGVARSNAIADFEKEQKLLFNKVSPAVVYILSGKGIGSGFFVRANLIVTNAHVVGGSASVDVVLQSGKKLFATVIAKAPKRIDLVLLQVDYQSPHVLTLSSGSLAIGDWVASVGHGVDSPWSFTTGMVSNIFKRKHTRPVFQTQIPLNPGNSGGPIVDRSGNVVGVVTSGIQASNSVNFAIHIDELIKAFPQQFSGECECLHIEAPTGAPIMVDGDFAGVGPVVLIPITAGSHEVTVTIDGAIEVRTVSYPKTPKVIFSKRR